MKRLLSITMALTLSMGLLAGCAGNEEKPAASSDAQAGTEQTADAAKIGIIFTEAGLGGQSFNDLAFEGMKRAEAELGITFDYVEPKSVSDEEIVQDEMAASEEYELIICVGAEQIDALTRVAGNYPDQKFALIDATVDLPNVATYVCKEQEGSFLVGAMAALAKQEKISDKLGEGKTVGFIGGVDNPLIRKFAAGFSAGAKFVDPEFEVLVDYVGGFNDPTTAKTIATTFHEKGADVIFHAAGASGMGLFQAAEENGFAAIGVNLNQNSVAPDHIMASMLKKVDSCAYHAIESVLNDTFAAGQKILGLADDGVGFTTEGSNIQLSETILAQLDELKAKVISGELVVPETLEQIDAFVAAK